MRFSQEWMLYSALPRGRGETTLLLRSAGPGRGTQGLATPAPLSQATLLQVGARAAPCHQQVLGAQVGAAPHSGGTLHPGQPWPPLEELGRPSSGNRCPPPSPTPAPKKA